MSKTMKARLSWLRPNSEKPIYLGNRKKKWGGYNLVIFLLDGVFFSQSLFLGLVQKI
jgi:hypothetical protein